jgi:dGTPase
MTDLYAPFDREYLRDDWNSERRSDYRSVFHQDRDRIMFTPAFRRLQAKTQVFQAGEYDFYRTRLTHSMEVANIAKSIAVWIRARNPAVAVDPDLLEAICLAHDIGHPPFGHAGERVLQEIMAPYGGFEGNAQTLRILTRTIYNRRGGRGGMSPTRALLDGVLKYKRLYRNRGDENNHFIYDDQAEILAFCFGAGDLGPVLGQDTKSIECRIMDAADDIAYSCFDLVDGAKARFLTPDRVRAWRESRQLDELQSSHFESLLEMMRGGQLQPQMNTVVGELIQAIDVAPTENALAARTQRHAWTLDIRPEARARIRLHKAVSRDLVFGSSALQQIEFKGGQVLRQLGRSLLENYLAGGSSPLRLVPEEVHRAVGAADSAKTRARLLCDHLSGMTDAYALRSYKRLFDPDYGSISELI